MPPATQGPATIQNQTLLVVALIAGILLFVFDLRSNFIRGGSYNMLFMLLYFLLAILVYWAIEGDLGRWSPHTARFVGMRWLFATFLPFLLLMLDQNVYSALSGTLGTSVGVLLAYVIGPYGSLILMYWGGFTRWLLGTAGQLPKLHFLEVIHNLIVFLIIFALALVIFDTIETVPGLQDGGELEVPGFGEMARDVWNMITGFVDDAKVTVAGIKNETITAIAPPTQAGTVERTQGRDLGVFFRELQPIPRVVQLRQEGDAIVPQDEVLVVYGTLEAQTFADDFPLELFCRYTFPDGRNITVPARPSSLTVRYTGEFKDSYQFECLYDIASLPLDSRTDLSGRFEVVARFPFETWGYTTLTFMDRGVMRALQQEGTDPARYLGITSRPKVLYTPGPVGLGMETVSQPIGIDAEHLQSNYLPRFTVAIENGWSARGSVTALDTLILQVPQEFDLQYGDCVGAESFGGPVVYAPGMEYDDDVVPQGYFWYEFRDVEFISDARQWLQCPLRPAGGDEGFLELLNPDLSARQYTLVTRVKYDYELTQPVAGARMQVVSAQ